MKPTRRKYAGEADPSSVSEAYERYLAERALAYAPKVLQKLVRDGYVESITGQLTARADQYRIFLYGPDERSFLSYWPGNGARTYAVKDPWVQRPWLFGSAFRAASIFRAIVDEKPYNHLLG